MEHSLILFPSLLIYLFIYRSTYSFLFMLENGGWNSNWNRGGGRGRGGWNSRGKLIIIMFFCPTLVSNS